MRSFYRRILGTYLNGRAFLGDAENRINRRLVGALSVATAIGEGGMGTVFMAEQVSPLQRRVAIKLIKPGMDSAQVMARFDAERQALAMMEHPNIARAIDVGASTLGRTYFVMELVKASRSPDIVTN